MPTLSILVLVASPLDYARYRHTALYLDFSDVKSTPTATKSAPEEGLIKSSIMEIVGLPGFFSFSERVNAALPSKATTLAHAVEVGKFSEGVSIAQLREVIGGTPIPRVIKDWNSQNWVGDVLARLVEAGYLDAGDSERGLDGMVEAVMEAGDEKIA